MSSPTDSWNEQLRGIFLAYDEPLLRRVLQPLLKPRNQWPVEDLIDRALDTLSNPPLVDRRLKELGPASRQVLGWMARSRQPRWPVGSLLEMLVILGHPGGLEPLTELFENGFLYPDLPTPGNAVQVRDFPGWVAGGTFPHVLAHPAVLARAWNEPLPGGECPGAEKLLGPFTQESDGLDWPLRLAVLWQQLMQGGLRRTQSGNFFKRDLDRLKTDPLLGGPVGESLDQVPDPALLTVAFAQALGIAQEHDGELHAGTFDASWSKGLPTLLERFFVVLPHLRGWNCLDGWKPEGEPANPLAAAYLLSLLLLQQLPDGSWADPAAVEEWVLSRHPFWAPTGGNGKPKYPRGCLVHFLLGLAFPLRWLQAAKNPEGQWRVRLSSLGRWLVTGKEPPPPPPGFAQTLLVQPNLEILAYRQGLNPELIVKLSRFAAWKSLGPACTLQLEPGSVYRALESGETLTSILQVLNRHGSRATPTPVVESLKTWSNKRERITIFAAGALFEFATPAELNEAIARGLPAQRLTDRLAIVPSEAGIDYRHFRLTGTRDYFLPPEQCVQVQEDGLTLQVDPAKSDLLLESELTRFAEPVKGSSQGPRLFRMTPPSLSQGRKNGLSLAQLESWFQQRCGCPPTPAARLLYLGPDAVPLASARLYVVQVPQSDIADGLEQWTQSRSFVQSRLGPNALVIREEDLEGLRKVLAEIGVVMKESSQGKE